MTRLTRFSEGTQYLTLHEVVMRLQSGGLFEENPGEVRRFGEWMVLVEVVKMGLETHDHTMDYAIRQVETTKEG